MKLKSKRGFSLVEVLTASAIFLISFTAITGMVAMITNRRSAASKHASMTRLASEEYQRYVRQGYDSLVAPGGFYDRADPDGRMGRFTVTVNPNCSDPFLPDSSIRRANLPSGATASQACCPGNLCCKALLVQMEWTDTLSPIKPSPVVREQYFGFVTKSCP